MKKENKSWNYGRFIVVISILFAFLYSCKYMIAKSPILNTEQVFLYGRIISVIDGDTVKIQFTNNGTICHETETVRLVGVNCPELNLHKDAEPEPYAIEARDYTNQFYQSEVIFYFDDVSDKRDKYSRLLGYVLLDKCPVTFFLFNLFQSFFFQSCVIVIVYIIKSYYFHIGIFIKQILCKKRTYKSCTTGYQDCLFIQIDVFFKHLHLPSLVFHINRLACIFKDISPKSTFRLDL